MRSYDRAAFRMLEIFEPSRDTPQSRRSVGSGTRRPWWARMIASAAAPHSTTSIWRISGVRTRPSGSDVAGVTGSIDLRSLPQDRHQVRDGRTSLDRDAGG